MQDLPSFSSLKNAVILYGTNNLHQDSPEDIVDGITKIGYFFKERHHYINVFICGLLLRDEYTSVNRVSITETNKISKVKCLLNKFIFIDQDKYWIQLNGCLNSDMFLLEKLHLAKKGNLVLAKSICWSMEYFHRAIISNEFKTYKLATTFQLNNGNFPLLSFKYACTTVPGCTKVPSSTIISNVVATYLRKFVCVCKFVRVPMFTQSISSFSYHVAKSCDLLAR